MKVKELRALLAGENSEAEVVISAFSGKGKDIKVANSMVFGDHEMVSIQLTDIELDNLVGNGRKELHADSTDGPERRSVLDSLRMAMPHIGWPVWDCRVFAPVGLDDLLQVMVKVCFVENGPWFTYTFAPETGTWSEEKE
jgi:hypothetical protein